jgi:dTDP-L-rhamnose 4-epimerase
MRILVTGGAGFIGSHTVDALIARGHQVRILDSLEKPVHRHGKPSYLNPAAEFVLGSVTQREDWTRALAGMEAVFHFAAYQDYLPDFSRFFRVNAVGTALLYELLVELELPMRKVVMASSQAVYGEGRHRCPATGSCTPAWRSRRLRAGRSSALRTAPAGRNVPTDESVVNPQVRTLSKHAQEQSPSSSEASRHPVGRDALRSCRGRASRSGNLFRSVSGLLSSHHMDGPADLRRRPPGEGLRERARRGRCEPARATG